MPNSNGVLVAWRVPCHPCCTLLCCPFARSSSLSLSSPKAAETVGEQPAAVDAPFHPAFCCWCAFLPPQLSVSWEYAVIIDAGSSGSRVHVFRYYGHKDTPWPTVELPSGVHKTSPGLSAYAFDPKTAASSLEPLLRFAKQAVGGLEGGLLACWLPASECAAVLVPPPALPRQTGACRSPRLTPPPGMTSSSSCGCVSPGSSTGCRASRSCWGC